MPFAGSLGRAVMGIKPRTRPDSNDVGGASGASHIPIRNPPTEKSHFEGLGPSEPLVMAPKQANTNMQPTLGMYPGNQGTGSGGNSMQNTRAQGLPAGMPPDLGMSSGPSMQPAMNPLVGMGQGMMGGGMNPGGLGPSMDPLMKRRMMAGRPAGF